MSLVWLNGPEQPGGTGPQEAADPPGTLSREVSLPMLVLFGLGTTIGAGIYALLGEVAAVAGSRAPLSFLVAAALASLTGVGFAELAGRLPTAAGEAVFVNHAFGRRRLTGAVGLAVVVAGVVGAATITNSFGGYVEVLSGVSPTLSILGLALLLGLVAIAGVGESVRTAALFTMIEVAGLALVVFSRRDVFAEIPASIDTMVLPPTSLGAWSGVFGGAFLAFFAFLGFEDIDSVAEETEDVRRVMPRAILATLAITAVVYVTVSMVAVLGVGPTALSESDAPLALVYESSGGRPEVLSIIAALAMINGALVHLVMIPRVLYGLSNLGLVPRRLGAVSTRTRTPITATVLAVVTVVLLATTIDLTLLAKATSATTLGLFVAINLSLIKIKRDDPVRPTFEVPMWVPVAGATASAALLIGELVRVIGS